ncbi:bifunctional DNA-formamidopyrimidine glycosylase/DNA-(apurinic or apyrimidinic site) lyase [Thiomicrospira cyclica]|uniref:Formamidopyrimidine-DNA glycosylase n=1 Tax=Thiomicrospira cyclica (strain DSM 14477 / JCM 11371 / ALM1) TaxID=717773 RepID=F6DAA1_THICA|nr:bifunctional DNA-formamidopyrimidine glycosylase/DNA-(apurinic or apyrimidinic site) lyase [Thiomicrospira cyclica]AEG31067.1 Formamidopyrimidine-DNA glycosylase [Thiomicrospira cyclica ALM1]
MPELPEVETTLRGIAPSLTGQTVAALQVHQGRLRWPVPTELTEKLALQPLLHLRRRAKYLLLDFPTGTLIIHLGMSGSLRILPVDTPRKKHDHIDLITTQGQTLRYHDPRRFGAWLWTEDTAENHPLLNHLGPEPLDDAFDANWLLQQAKNRKIPLKTLIMDNKVVVGVGNIYANESLFLAGLHPNMAAKDLNSTQAERWVMIIKQVLAKAIEQGGTTLRDFYNADGQAGYFKQHLYVYGRTGLACQVCGTRLEKMIIQQRASVFCPQCQPLITKR